MKAFADIADLDEDSRIDLIGNTVLKEPQSSGSKPLIIGFVVEDNQKADRYIAKLQKKFPTVMVELHDPMMVARLSDEIFLSTISPNDAKGR